MAKLCVRHNRRDRHGTGSSPDRASPEDESEQCSSCCRRDVRFARRSGSAALGGRARARLLRSRTSRHASDARRHCRVGRAGELDRAVGRLLLVTVAEVRLDDARLRRHRLREVCDPYMRMPSETTASVASPTDDERCCLTGFCLAILNWVAWPAGAPWRSRRSLARQSSRPVLACIIGAFRPCIAPMISSEEIPSR